MLSSSCVQEAAAFEVALDNVDTILKLDEEGAREYGRSVTDLARELKLGITSTEAMAGAYEVASAGWEGLPGAFLVRVFSFPLLVELREGGKAGVFRGRPGQTGVVQQSLDGLPSQRDAEHLREQEEDRQKRAFEDQGQRQRIHPNQGDRTQASEQVLKPNEHLIRILPRRVECLTSISGSTLTPKAWSTPLCWDEVRQVVGNRPLQARRLQAMRYIPHGRRRNTAGPPGLPAGPLQVKL